jgi:hypothetical protein
MRLSWQQDGLWYSNNRLKSAMLQPQRPKRGKSLQSKLEAGFTERESVVVRVVVKHSQNDVAVDRVFDVADLVHHVVLIGEGSD